jgi:hypothetical protein
MKRHLAEEDIEELRQLVHLATLEKAATNAQATDVGDAVAVLVIGSHHWPPALVKHVAGQSR